MEELKGKMSTVLSNQEIIKQQLAQFLAYHTPPPPPQCHLDHEGSFLHPSFILHATEDNVHFQLGGVSDWFGVLYIGGYGLLNYCHLVPTMIKWSSVR